MDELLVTLIFALLAAAFLLAPLVLSIIAFQRTRRITTIGRRLDEIEALIRRVAQPMRQADALREDQAPSPETPTPALRETQRETAPSVAPVRRLPTPIDWERLIGRRALGWIAGLSIVLAAAFFLRYAFENQWIGPLGRVALAQAAGVALAIGGWYYERRGWRIFSPMLTGAAIVLFYLATYSAFGFYNLLPRQAATAFLVVIVVESMGLAVLYDRMPLGLVAILGGLLTPALVRSEHDQYLALFTYLAVLDAGIVVLALWRDWAAVASAALVGTHALFWTWYEAQYHPEKRPVAVTFLIIIYVIFVAYDLILHVGRTRAAGWEALVRWLANAFLAFLAFYVLLNPPYHVWMGTLAVTAAVVYAAIGRLILARRPDDIRLFLSTIAVAVGFIALAFPIQADASWIALGWAAEAAALWWFGLRLHSPTLRILGGSLAMLAVCRVVVIDTPNHTRNPFIPILNRYALPALGVAACVLGSVALSRSRLSQLATGERRLVVATAIAGVVLLGLVLSADIYVYCDLQSSAGGVQAARWNRIGQVSLSVLWAAYATAILAVGFRVDRVWLRWTALGCYGLTLVKVFLVDLAGLGELYRVMAFFALAVALGVAARAYHGFRPASGLAGAAGGGDR
jgi:uncharacterized membrane protein